MSGRVECGEGKGDGEQSGEGGGLGETSHEKQGNCGKKWEGTELHGKDMQLSIIHVLMLSYLASLMAPSPASLALPNPWERWKRNALRKGI